MTDTFNFSVDRMAAGGTCFQIRALVSSRHRSPPAVPAVFRQLGQIRCPWLRWGLTPRLLWLGENVMAFR
jgi:hypothetical protein